MVKRNAWAGWVCCTPKVGTDPTFGVSFMAKYDEQFKRKRPPTTPARTADRQT
jgi:hypothetical protein